MPARTVTGRSVLSRKREAGNAKPRGLLLDPARVGEHRAGVRLEREEVEVSRRLGEGDALLRVEPEGLQTRPGARMDGEEHGHLARDRGERRPSHRPGAHRRRAPGGGASPAGSCRARAQGPRRRPASGSGLRAPRGCRSSCFPPCGPARPASPRRARFSVASAEWRKRISDRWSTTIRLISSGISRSKLRRPDSTWAIGISRPAAHNAAASVELTSPGTMTRSGRSSRRTGSSRSMMRAACSAWEPEPTPSMWSGSGTPSSVEEHVRHRPVVVLTSVDDDVRRLAEALAAGADDRRHLHEVRPRADDVEQTRQVPRCLFRKSIWSTTARSKVSPR